MTVVVTIQHPAHVHFFRNAIEELRAGGEEVDVFVRREPPAAELLDHYGIPYTVLAEETSGMTSLPFMQLGYEYRLYRHTRKLDPDVFLAIGGVAASHVARLCGANSAIFTDTEHATIVNTLAAPAATTVYTPECFEGTLRGNQVRYPGYHELAYLHPSRYTPEPADAVRADLGVDADDQLVILRLSNWKSSHDVGEGGFDDIAEVVKALEDAGGTVRITSERSMDDDLDPYRVAIEPHRMHDVLATADLFVGEGATMAAESAVLGTPSVYVNSLELGYITELHEEYGLTYPYHDRDRHVLGTERATDLLAAADEPWGSRRERLLEEKVDTTDVILEAVEDHRPRAEPPRVSS